MNQGKTSLINKDREFQRYYALYLKPLEQRFESLRQKAVEETKWRIIAALSAWLAAVGVIGYLAPFGDAFTVALFIACVLLAGLGLGLWAWLPAQAHVDKLKEQILPRIVSFFGDLRYQSEPNFDPERYRDWKVLPVFDETYLEDQINAHLKAKKELRHIIVYANSINDMDATGEEALSLIIDRVRRVGVDISFAGANRAVMAVLERTHLLAKIGEDHFYPTIDRAIKTVHKLTHNEKEEEACPLTSVCRVP